MGKTTVGRMPAKKVLEAAKSRVSRDVLVVSRDRKGELYVASSMPSGSLAAMEQQVALAEAALRALRRVRDYAKKKEQGHVQEG